MILDRYNYYCFASLCVAGAAVGVADAFTFQQQHQLLFPFSSSLKEARQSRRVAGGSSFLPLSARTAIATTALSAADADSSSTDTTTTTPLSSDYEFALLFDCDGVILETEELHRLAYNEAFAEFQLELPSTQEPVEWSVPYYDMLQNTVAGGKPKMWFHFTNTTGGEFPIVLGRDQQLAPTTQTEQQALIDELQDFKTQAYKRLLETNAVPRPGVLELMDAALRDDRIAVGVCSASTKEAALKTLDLTLGPDRVRQLNVCILGDDVAVKKPDPMIYNRARERLGFTADQAASRCVVIEDSMVGLRAAVAADMHCIITYTSSTAQEDFYGQGASAKVPDLTGVTLEAIFEPLRQQNSDSGDGILAGLKDPVPEAVIAAAPAASSSN